MQPAHPSLVSKSRLSITHTAPKRSLLVGCVSTVHVWCALNWRPSSVGGGESHQNTSVYKYHTLHGAAAARLGKRQA